MLRVLAWRHAGVSSFARMDSDDVSDVTRIEKQLAGF